MSAAANGVKALLSVKIKPREDGYCDQFNRIFMLKVMLSGTLLLSLNWYTDKITCIIPDTLKIDGGFVSSACWINGLYVYEDIRYHANEVGYYGIPRDISMDGKDTNGNICASSIVTNKRRTGCKEMQKTFFLQYQYLAFLLLAMSVFYYAPYALFRKVNEDMKSLKGSLNENDADAIVSNYFNETINPRAKLRLRIMGDFLVKVLYVFTSIAAFLLLDTTLNEGYMDYGLKWLQWSKLKNSLAFDYMGQRHSPKPGNELLPSFGFCEVHESAQDIKHVITNTHKFLCEISQHVLYQYTFLVIWFTMVVSIVAATLGLLQLLWKYFTWSCCSIQVATTHRSIYKSLALREVQYLEFIRTKSTPLYFDVVRLLKGERNGGLVGKEVLPEAPDTDI